MKQQANLIRAGQVIEHDGRRWTVLKQRSSPQVKAALSSKLKCAT